ncbi:hypothetical protein [Leptospira levettii]|uniref:hypothetical protein n=1 Tax=Leptospira levettii TaxID=2023178 RepID=UPI001083A90E|nr:hypothetical protein [Leptospira levettii]TGM24782.1 hypothetical protein EHQ74_14650 [Leptospira levettii]TGM91986.1 hypothetical protein EHR02_03995 [Leptospira levettii]
MFSEKPVWIWKGNPELVLLQLVGLLLFFYFAFRISAYFTHRYELVQMHRKRLDRLAFRAGCNQMERSLLQTFYNQLDRHHRVLLAHNHAKEYLRAHLLQFVSQLGREEERTFLSLVAKFLGTARETSPLFGVREFVLVHWGKDSYLAQVVDPGISEVRIRFSPTKRNTGTPIQTKITVFREPKGFQSIHGSVEMETGSTFFFRPNQR